MLRNVRGRENWCIAYRGPARSAGSGSKVSPPLFFRALAGPLEPWRVPSSLGGSPLVNYSFTMLRNGILMIDNVPLRDIKCKVNLEHVNDLLGIG